MATQEETRMRDRIIQKLTTGVRLDDAEKAHLGECEDCMARVIEALDRSAANGTRAHVAGAGGINGDLAHPHPEAKKAIDRGRKVLEREFGITF